VTVEKLTEVPGLPPATRYAYAAVTGGRIAFLAGQVATGPDGESIGPGDMRAQADQALRNLGAVIAALGAGWADVARLTWYVTDATRVQEVRDARVAAMGDHLPASTLVQVAALVSPEFLVEVDAVVELP